MAGKVGAPFLTRPIEVHERIALAGILLEKRMVERNNDIEVAFACWPDLYGHHVLLPV
jgi:hypothetical protein